MTLQPGDLGHQAFKGFANDRQTTPNLPMSPQQIAAFKSANGQHIPQDRKNFQVFAGHSIRTIEDAAASMAGQTGQAGVQADGVLTRQEMMLYFLTTEGQTLLDLKKHNSLEHMTGKHTPVGAARLWTNQYMDLIDRNGDARIDDTELAAKLMVQSQPADWLRNRMLDDEADPGNGQVVKRDVLGVILQVGNPKEAAWVLEQVPKHNSCTWSAKEQKIIQLLKSSPSNKQFQATLQANPGLHKCFTNMQLGLVENPERLAAIPWKKFENTFPNSDVVTGTQLTEVGRILMQAQWMGRQDRNDYYDMSPFIAAAHQRNPMTPIGRLPASDASNDGKTNDDKPEPPSSGGGFGGKKILGMAALLIAFLGLTGKLGGKKQQPAPHPYFR